MTDEKPISLFYNIFPRKGEPLFWVSSLIWLFTILGVLFTAILFIYIEKERGIPSFEELENPDYNWASFVFDNKGNEFGKYYVENREGVEYGEINPQLIEALITTEDLRFLDHDGIDFKSLWRVGIKTVILGQKSAGGGSTLTQQLAKLLYKRAPLSGLSSWKQKLTLVESKLKEWVTATKLEKSYTKEEIIAMYLNKFEFVNGAHGIQSAANIYFNKDQNELNLQECAMLVGMLKNPSLFNPNRFPKRTLDRRNVVLQLLHEHSIIKINELDSLRLLPLDMTKFKKQTPIEGPAPYFRYELVGQLKRLFAENNIVKPGGKAYNVFTDGLKIFTSIDLDYQRLAEESVSEHMTWLQERYWKVWKNKDILTYGADRKERDLRASNLIKRIRRSDRYIELRLKHIPSLLEVDQELDLSDDVLEKLLEGTINDEPKYEKLLESDVWSKIKKEYLVFKKIYTSTFATVNDTKVFDHQEKEKVMSLSPTDSILYHLQHLQNGLLAVDPISGYIKAWVGGIDFDHFKYDHVTSPRQIGSIIKPFVYTTAMQDFDISPCQTYDDIPYIVEAYEANFNNKEEWKPNNSTETFTTNPYNLYHGLLYSKNSITVKLMKEMGTTDNVRDLLHKVGLSKTDTVYNGHLLVPDVPAICLGAIDATLFQMVGAYTTFVNGGTYSKPLFINKIEDRYGNIIYNGHSAKSYAIDPLHNSVMLDMLQNNVKRNFSFDFKSKAGGKTGTTNDYVDGWFMGITPELVVGVWTGGDERFVRFLSIDNGQGYVMARPVFEKFIQKLEKLGPQKYDVNAKFPNAHPQMKAITDCEKYKTIPPAVERKMRAQAKRFESARDSIMLLMETFVI